MLESPLRRRAARALLAFAGATVLATGAGCGGDDGDESAAPRTTAQDASRAVVAVAADIGIQPPGLATLEAMAEADAAANVLLGDLSYAGRGSEKRFCDIARRTFGADAPVQLLAGNHEEDSGEDGRIANFAACLGDRMGSEGEYARQYAFDVGRLARFVLISPDLTIEGRHYFYGTDEDGRDTPEMAWLKRTIDGARDEGIRWVVVGMHKSCISVGPYYCDVYQELFSTLIEKKVDLVLSGHEHNYQRSKQLAAGTPGCREVIVDEYDRQCVADADDEYRRGAGTAFVITGHGGRPLYKIRDDDPEAGYFVKTMGRNTRGARFGFMKLELSDDEMVVDFVASAPGSFDDRFVIGGS